MATDLLELKPTLQSWVPHIMVFIVPRQILPLGDPTRRSCDACESLGARLKIIIKLLTCRRRHASANSTTEHKRRAGSGRQLWKQSFTKGYIQQAFTRMCVSEALKHGEDNAPYLQRADILRANTGLGQVKKERDACEKSSALRELVRQEFENA